MMMGTREVAIPRTQRLAHLEAVDVRQHQVEHNQDWALLLSTRKRAFAPLFRQRGAITGLFPDCRQQNR
jgi:hypothetical protein